jgi:hypothetical protein
VDERRRVQYLDGGHGPEEIPPLGLAHPRAQHQKQRPETLPPRRQGAERRLDERRRGPLSHPGEKSLDLVYGLESPLMQRGTQAMSTLGLTSFRGGW